jgi:C-terminal processing protease CtpA/Prc
MVKYIVSEVSIIFKSGGIMAVRIIDVEKGTPAHKYNIMPGDELVSINGEEIFDISIFVDWYNITTCILIIKNL